MFSIFASNAFNESVVSYKFLSVLKLANVKPVHKKASRLEKTNYRPVSLLPNISKIFQRCMHRQISDYFEIVLSKFQCGFRKGYSTQDCLLAMVENCKKALDQGNEYGVLLTDLSKAFDCLPHDLIVAKLHAYGLSIDSLKLINSYLTERKQRVKINDQFSSWLDIVVGVSQGSILGPLLFNIFLCDMFLFCNDIDFASYADDNTPYCIGKTPEEVIRQLEKSSKSIVEWFNNLHERALRLIYCDHSSDFQELLQRDNFVTIHQKNLQALAIMMYKVVNNIAPTTVSELFSYSNVNYNLRSGFQFHQPSANTVWNGQETIPYLGQKIWNMVPEEMKQKSSLLAFKREIKQWVPDNCPCRIRVYLIPLVVVVVFCFFTIYFLSFFFYCAYAHFFFGFDT